VTLEEFIDAVNILGANDLTELFIIDYDVFGNVLIGLEEDCLEYDSEKDRIIIK